MKIHELKCHPSEFEAIKLGLKTAEVRIDDGRGFECGDVLVLMEWDTKLAEGFRYTGREIKAVVKHLQKLDKFGISIPDAITVIEADGSVSQPRFVSMSISVIEVSE